jgi:thioredoxin 1
MALRINAENFEEKVIHSDKPVLLDFYSDSCIPCKRMAGPLGDVEDEYENQIYVYKVNVNYDGELAEKYNVMSAPTLVFIVDGEEKSRLTGAADKNKIIELFADKI